MIRIIEVGPRDGLQNEKHPIPTQTKLKLIENLVGAGLTEIEATSFVSPKWVPQLADAEELWGFLPAGVRFSALVPNERGLARALGIGVGRIALFTAASDAFTQRNINMSVEESIEVFRKVAVEFREAQPDGFLRGYLSTVFECPFSGKVDFGRVVNLVDQLFALGCDEVSLGDTTGVAGPREVRSLARKLADRLDIVWHFHDTHGTGLANVQAALDAGFRAFDASAGGLGGCPYAPGATGNVATEDVVYLLERQGIATAIDLDRLAVASLPVLEVLGRSPESRVQRAVLARLRA